MGAHQTEEVALLGRCQLEIQQTPPYTASMPKGSGNILDWQSYINLIPILYDPFLQNIAFGFV